MIRPDAKVARAMTFLTAAELAPFVEYLKALRLDTLERLAIAPEGVAKQLQGEVQLLKRLLEDIENSHALAAKLQQSRSAH